MCIIYFYPKKHGAKIVCTYIWRNYVWTEVWCSQWYNRSITGNIICMYRQQQKMIPKLFLYIHFTKYTLYLPSTKNMFHGFFVCTLQNIFIFKKINKIMKYNVARTIIFLLTLQKIFIVLCALDQIKFLSSDFWKWDL